MNPVSIIGMGQGPGDLTETHIKIIRDCDVLIGGPRHLEHFNDQNFEKILITADIKGLVKKIKTAMPEKKITVLASGDPLFYGIGSTLIRHIDKAYLNIYSNISSVSAAFAAIKEPWHDARIISLHGLKNKQLSFGSLAGDDKIAFLTDSHMTPNSIAENLTIEGLIDFRCCVLENLGNAEKERITWYNTPELMKTQEFSSPNIVILIKSAKIKKKTPCETHSGMDDTLFKHKQGLITKSEIRAIAISKLKLIKKDHVLWDIGSGSGSVGIEASFQIPWGQVYSIEKHSERIADIIQNIKNFNCSNIKVLHASFPEGVEEIKAPDRIFIGGGGEKLGKVIDAACEILLPYGIIVINTVLIQNINTALEHLKKNNIEPGVVQVQVSRSRTMPFGDRMEALNPVWIISGSKS